MVVSGVVVRRLMGVVNFDTRAGVVREVDSKVDVPRFIAGLAVVVDSGFGVVDVVVVAAVEVVVVVVIAIVFLFQLFVVTAIVLGITDDALEVFVVGTTVVSVLVVDMI